MNAVGAIVKCEADAFALWQDVRRKGAAIHHYDMGESAEIEFSRRRDDVGDIFLRYLRFEASVVSLVWNSCLFQEQDKVAHGFAE